MISIDFQRFLIIRIDFLLIAINLLLISNDFLLILTISDNANWFPIDFIRFPSDSYRFQLIANDFLMFPIGFYWFQMIHNDSYWFQKSNFVFYPFSVLGISRNPNFFRQHFLLLNLGRNSQYNTTWIIRHSLGPAKICRIIRVVG